MPIVDMKMIVLRIRSPMEKVGHPSLKIEISKSILSKTITEMIHKQQIKNATFLAVLMDFKCFVVILALIKNVRLQS